MISSESEESSCINKVSADEPTDVSTSSDVKKSAFDKHPIRKLIAMPMNRSLVLYFIMLFAHIPCKINSNFLDKQENGYRCFQDISLHKRLLLSL